MTSGIYHKSTGGATYSEAPEPIPAGPPHVVRYALNCGPGLNIPAWAVYIALAHFSDDHGLSERTHREIADAIDAGSVSTVKVALQHLEYFGKVEVTRRPGATAGRNLPNVYRITGEEFDWEPTPKEPREPGQIFAAYRRRHAEIEAEHRRSYEELEQSHRQREQDLLRRIGELEAAVNGHAPRQGEGTTSPTNESTGRREPAIQSKGAPRPSPDNPGLPGSFRNGTPEPSEDIPTGGTAGPPQSHVRESHGQELDSRETAIAPDRYPPEEEQGEEDEVDVLTREFWPWMKGKWDDINYAIHWYKRNRGEWTRQLKNARAARAAEEHQQAKPEDQADRHRPGYEQGGKETEGVPVWDSSIPADPDARSLWDAVLADLQVRLPRPTFETLGETNGGRGLPRRPVNSGRPDSLRRGIAGTKDVPRIAEHPGKGWQARTCNCSCRPWRPITAMTPRWGMLIRAPPQARITNQGTTNHGITNQEVKPVSEGKAARVAGAAVTYAAIRYRNAARAARKRGEIPLRDEVARARARLLISAAAAWHPLWLKWRASLGETHLPDSPIPPAQTRLGEVFQASKRFGFALSQGHQSHTPAGEILRAAERLRRKDYTSMPWKKTSATDTAAAPQE